MNAHGHPPVSFVDGEENVVRALSRCPAGFPPRRYCESHCANDPGGTMLAKIFGAEWATAYARGFLFRTESQGAR